MEAAFTVEQPDLEIGMVRHCCPGGVAYGSGGHLNEVEVAGVLAENLGKSDARHGVYRRRTAARRRRSLGPDRQSAQPRTPPRAPKTMWFPKARMNP